MEVMDVALPKDLIDQHREMIDNISINVGKTEFDGSDEHIAEAREERLAIRRSRLEFTKTVDAYLKTMREEIKAVKGRVDPIVADFKRIESKLEGWEKHKENKMLEERKQYMLSKGVVSLPKGIDIKKLDDVTFRTIVDGQAQAAADPKAEALNATATPASGDSRSVGTGNVEVNDIDAFEHYLHALLSVPMPYTEDKALMEKINEVNGYLKSKIHE